MLLLALCCRLVPLSLQDFLSQQKKKPHHREAAGADWLPTIHECLVLPPPLLLVWILLLFASPPLTVRLPASAAAPLLQ
jgi:hypothetical protein